MDKSITVARMPFGMKLGKGMEVTKVDAGGAAEEAGVVVGDALLAVEGVPVEWSTYRQLLTAQPPPFMITFRPAAVEPSPPPPVEKTVQVLRMPFGMKLGKDLNVTKVDAGGAAEEAGVAVGDTLISVEGQTVSWSTYRQLLTAQPPPFEVTFQPAGVETQEASIPEAPRIKSIQVTKMPFGMKVGKGMNVTKVEVGSPAELAGIVVGDMLLTVEGAAVSWSDYKHKLTAQAPPFTITLSPPAADALDAPASNTGSKPTAASPATRRFPKLKIEPPSPPVLSPKAPAGPCTGFPMDCKSCYREVAPTMRFAKMFAATMWKKAWLGAAPGAPKRHTRIPILLGFVLIVLLFCVNFTQTSLSSAEGLARARRSGPVDDAEIPVAPALEAEGMAKEAKDKMTAEHNNVEDSMIP